MRHILQSNMPALLSLNNAHAVELSKLTLERLGQLLAISFYSCTAPDASGFLMCFDQYADYDSFNFLWFKARYQRFVYIDRVVVSPAARGKGLAGRFYAGLSEKAASSGHTMITCEVNSDPPNPASDAFHNRLGFVEVGQARLAHAEKSVRFLAKDI